MVPYKYPVSITITANYTIHEMVPSIYYYYKNWSIITTPILTTMRCMQHLLTVAAVLPLVAAGVGKPGIVGRVVVVGSCLWHGLFQSAWQAPPGHATVVPCWLKGRALHIVIRVDSAGFHVHVLISSQLPPTPCVHATDWPALPPHTINTCSLS